jgi:hypothetical protein
MIIRKIIRPNGDSNLGQFETEDQFNEWLLKHRPIWGEIDSEGNDPLVIIDLSREYKLNELRAARNQKLLEADILINKAFDLNEDTTPIKAYRQALREVTDMYKTMDVANEYCDSLDIENFVWPII